MDVDAVLHHCIAFYAVLTVWVAVLLVLFQCSIISHLHVTGLPHLHTLISRGLVKQIQDPPIIH